MKQGTEFPGLEKYGAIGVAALQAATPVDSAATRDGWYYEIVKRKGYFAIHWLNSNIVEPGTIPVAVLLQYGHGTRNGGYVQGIDYINPALKPIFEQMANDMWKEVTK
jgi:hypothetical protein